MLRELRITNFAVIDSLTVEFSHGFHVLTGETGAGKSILIDAIALLIGGRSSTDQIRANAQEAEIEGLFFTPKDTPVWRHLQDLELSESGEEELIIRRILSRTGRNRVYLNGHLTSLSTLQRLAGVVVDIHGQHDQQSLLAPSTQLDALDTFGHLQPLREQFGVQYHAWQEQMQALVRLQQEVDQRKKQQEFIQFQYQEISEANLVPGEEEALINERTRLMHTVRLGELGEQAFHVLYERDASVLTELSSVKGRLRELEGIDHAHEEWVHICEGSLAQLQELADHLRDYLHGLEHDPDRLSEVEDRLDRIQRLKKKYGGSLDSILVEAQELKLQLDQLENSDKDIGTLKQQVEWSEKELRNLGEQLTQQRSVVAKELQQLVLKELTQLRMEGTRFEIQCQKRDGDSPFGETGCDDVEYLFSANQGEPLHPLSRVASGGELSRVMLSMKTVLAGHDLVPVLVFDEVDSGIGGAVAEVMGQRLKALGRFHQVLCITHLPQVASYAEHHFYVEKVLKKERTMIAITALDHTSRSDEVARMLGGVSITKRVRDTAEEMIGGAQTKRKRRKG